MKRTYYKVWHTTITAVCPIDSKIKNYGGPLVYGKTKEDAIKYCNTHGLAYCRVDGAVTNIEITKKNKNRFCKRN